MAKRKRNKLRSRRPRRARVKKNEISDEFKRSLGIDPDKVNRKDRINPPVRVLPKTAEFISMEKEQIIEDIFEDDLDKFLKRYYRANQKCLIYSQLIPDWEKDRSTRRAIKWLKKKTTWPKHLKQVINLLRTLEKHYDAELNRPNMELAYEIWDLFEQEISDYFRKAWTKKVERRGWDKIRKISKKKAWKEQKALGYIHVNDFEDFDRTAAHVFSNIKRDYVIPINFSHGIYKGKNNDLKTNIYIGQSLYSTVPGYARTVIPK